MEQVKQLLLTTLREFFRNPGIVFWAMFFPILMAVGLGFAFGSAKDIHHKVPIIHADVDGDLSKFVDQKVLCDSMDNLTVYVDFYSADEEEVVFGMKDGRVLLYIDNAQPGLHMHFDPNNSEAMLLSYQLNKWFSESELDDANMLHSARDVVQGKGIRYIDFLVPGLLGMGIMMSCMWGVSYSLIDKRGKKLLRRMVATPMSKPLFLLSQFLGRLVLGVIEAVVLLIFSWIMFDFTNAGSWFHVIVTFISANMAFSGIAILVSSRTSNTQVGNGLINVVVMPMMILSGVFFSYWNFPESIAGIIEWMPLTAVVDNFREVFLIGDPGPNFWLRILMLWGVGIVALLVGKKIYRWY